ncbi:MAG: hypothetical protein SGILL_009305 [Bacillariaceae sp.]
MEPLAFAQYKEVAKDSVVQETGMHILKHVVGNNKQYLLGASPDGMIVQGNDDDDSTNGSNGGLLEIKSLWGRRHNKGLPKFDHCPKRYYDQIQGQLAICDKEWCDLMLFIPPNGSGGSGGGKRSKKQQKKQAARMRKRQEKEKQNPHANSPRRHGQNYSIVRVERNEKYWNETLLPALVAFCDEVEEQRRNKAVE